MGTYHWVATYNGDANNTTVSSACAAEPVTITQATPTITTSTSPAGAGRHLHLGHGDGERRLQPHRHGHLQAVPADATRPAPGPRSSPPRTPLSGGQRHLGPPSPTTTVGIYHWVAIYNGDANNTTVSSGCAAEPVTITQATPTIATTPSAGGPVGTPIIDTATVTGGFNPTGTVTFELFPPEDTDLHRDPRLHLHKHP